MPLQTPTARQAASVAVYDSSTMTLPAARHRQPLRAGGVQLHAVRARRAERSPRSPPTWPSPASPVTQAILASANEITAAICTVTGQRPAAVCSAHGVDLPTQRWASTPG
jgi:hypothetical protein